MSGSKDLQIMQYFAQIQAMQKKHDAEIAALRAAVSEAEEVARTALQQIRQWADAYPEDIFTPLSDEELKAVVAAAEKAVPHGSSRLHAGWARHILGAVRRIAAEALEEMDREARLKLEAEEFEKR